MKPLEKINISKHEKISHSSWQPYTRAIGEAAVSWNALHDELSMLFVAMMKPDHATVPLAVWHRIESDRLQRVILLASAKARLAVGGRSQAAYDRIVSDIDWLVKKADAVGEARNNAVHAPLRSLTNMATRENTVKPLTTRGNPRALKLNERDLLSEFNWCRDAATTLTGFSLNIRISLTLDDEPWPTRPQLPLRQR